MATLSPRQNPFSTHHLLLLLLLAACWCAVPALKCVQCDSEQDRFCRTGLVPPTPCRKQSAVSCQTMVGKATYPDQHYVNRFCTSKIEKSRCTTMPSFIPGEAGEIICIRSCFEDGCNAEPVSSPMPPFLRQILRTHSDNSV